MRLDDSSALSPREPAPEGPPEKTPRDAFIRSLWTTPLAGFGIWTWCHSKPDLEAALPVGLGLVLFRLAWAFVRWRAWERERRQSARAAVSRGSSVVVPTSTRPAFPEAERAEADRAARYALTAGGCAVGAWGGMASGDGLDAPSVLLIAVMFTTVGTLVAVLYAWRAFRLAARTPWSMATAFGGVLLGATAVGMTFHAVDREQELTRRFAHFAATFDPPPGWRTLDQSEHDGAWESADEVGRVAVMPGEPLEERACEARLAKMRERLTGMSEAWRADHRPMRPGILLDCGERGAAVAADGTRANYVYGIKRCMDWSVEVLVTEAASRSTDDLLGRVGCEIR